MQQIKIKLVGAVETKNREATKVQVQFARYVHFIFQEYIYIYIYLQPSYW